MNEFEHYLANIENATGVSGLFQKDFLLTWESSPEELKTIFNIADALKYLHSNNISAKVLSLDWQFHCFGIIRLVPDFLMHLQQTCLV